MLLHVLIILTTLANWGVPVVEVGSFEIKVMMATGKPKRVHCSRSSWRFLQKHVNSCMLESTTRQNWLKCELLAVRPTPHIVAKVLKLVIEEIYCNDEAPFSTRIDGLPFLLPCSRLWCWVVLASLRSLNRPKKYHHSPFRFFEQTQLIFLCVSVWNLLLQGKNQPC